MIPTWITIFAVIGILTVTSLIGGLFFILLVRENEDEHTS
jgi:hypothetical protein